MTNETNTIRKTIKDHIQQAAFVEKDKIKNDSLIFKEGYFDSMGFIMLITYIEEEFKIQTSDEDLIEENFESIDAITSYILRKKSKK